MVAKRMCFIDIVQVFVAYDLVLFYLSIHVCSYCSSVIVFFFYLDMNLLINRGSLPSV